MRITSEPDMIFYNFVGRQAICADKLKFCRLQRSSRHLRRGLVLLYLMSNRSRRKRRGNWLQEIFLRSIYWWSRSGNINPNHYQNRSLRAELQSASDCQGLGGGDFLSIDKTAVAGIVVNQK